MFRRRWSGLPTDPMFADTLKELGYFINEDDEIRSLEDPDNYFKYFTYKNERWNERLRFSFNQAVSKTIHARLDTLGLVSLPLPLGTPTTSPHVPIRTSPSLASSSRVVVLFGDASQEFGVLSHRVIGGRGGITKGSVLSLVDALKTQRSSATDPTPPGLVLANPGELWWWPEGGCGLNPTARHRVPMSSAVHLGRYHDPESNEIEGNRSVKEHVRCVFESVAMGDLVRKGVKLDVIAVGDVADEVEEYLDDDEVWGEVSGMMGSLVVLGGFYNSANFKCEGFAKFMKERARAYIIHHEPLDTPLAGPSGNPGVIGFTSFGCPVYSAGEADVVEMLLVEAQPAILKWIQEVALEGEAYKNEVFEIFGEKPEDVDTPWGPRGSDTDAEQGEVKDMQGTAADGDVQGDGGDFNPRSVGGDAPEIKGERGEPKASIAKDSPNIKDVAELEMGVERLKVDN
ncbi:hypothetical protein BT67DRAFT_398629 [Trichocladium antarcticum]|uniref:Arb2 domain-containing protein n=1 Tax=Trichocladium antarcticum TaxID=1450529 RepID=A0AAN6ZGP1_9PEZI|nr:hypothetical protein BT67DRAFT_398629 [Trichocladium antarcticum]